MTFSLVAMIYIITGDAAHAVPLVYSYTDIATRDGHSVGLAFEDAVLPVSSSTSIQITFKTFSSLHWTLTTTSREGLRGREEMGRCKDG